MSFVSGTVEVIVATLLVYFLFDTHVRENTNTCVCTKNHILKTTNTQKTHSQKSSCIQIQNTNTTITMHLITTYANCIQIQNTNTAITMHAFNHNVCKLYSNTKHKHNNNNAFNRNVRFICNGLIYICKKSTSTTLVLCILFERIRILDTLIKLLNFLSRMCH